VTPLECPHEHEVVSVVLSHRWPHGCDEELRIHASECEVCRDAVTVACVLQEDAQAARRDVQVPAAGQVWWRSAIRARVEAVQAAERPMTWLHGLAGACAAGLVAALISVVWPSVAAWLAARSWTVSPSLVESGELFVSTMQRNLPVALAIAACVILAPIAVYLATNDE
jgi:hypothetical protein